MTPALFPALIFDVETTGLFKFDQPADAPGQPRMLSIAAGLIYGPTTEPQRWLEAVIKPDGWTVPDEVARINGISTDQAMAEGRPIKEVMFEWAQLFDTCRSFGSYGIAFDSKMIRAELRRLGHPDRYGHRPDFDLMMPCTKLCNLPPSEKMMASGRKTAKTPKLEEAVRILLGREHVGAHSAGADTRAAIELFRHLLPKGLIAPKFRLAKQTA